MHKRYFYGVIVCVQITGVQKSKIYIMNKLKLVGNFDNQCFDIDTAKLLLHDIRARDWSEKISTNPNLRTYITFKTSYTVEKYVLINLNKCELSILAQFRRGILPLRIETGQYTCIGEKPDERLCKRLPEWPSTCRNELHFLFNSYAYNDLRNHLLSIIYHKVVHSCYSLI